MKTSKKAPFCCGHVCLKCLDRSQIYTTVTHEPELCSINSMHAWLQFVA